MASKKYFSWVAVDECKSERGIWDVPSVVSLILIKYYIVVTYYLVIAASEASINTFQVGSQLWSLVCQQNSRLFGVVRTYVVGGCQILPPKGGGICHDSHYTIESFSPRKKNIFTYINNWRQKLMYAKASWRTSKIDAKNLCMPRRPHVQKFWTPKIHVGQDALTYTKNWCQKPM